MTTPSEGVDGWKDEVGGNVRGRDVREHGSGRAFRRLLRKMVCSMRISYSCYNFVIVL